MTVSVISSGSCGNSYIFYDGKSTIMVDCGVTLKRVNEVFDDLNIPPSTLKNVYITHFHPDHISGVGPVQRQSESRVWASQGAWVSAKSRIQGQKLRSSVCTKLVMNESADNGTDFRVIPFRTYHDVPGSVGYRIENGSFVSTIITDTGRWTRDMLEMAAGTKMLFVESNYDEDLIENGSYPAWLKARIASPSGHLSNFDTLDFCRNLDDNSERTICFIHISEENNTPESVASMAVDIPATKRGRWVVCERGKRYDFVDI